MRAQSIKEMLAIALPFSLAVMGFVILMGGFFEMTVKVAEAFIPHKVASMVLHTLTGSERCLVYEGDAEELPHKGLLSLEKIEGAVSESAAKQAIAYATVQTSMGASRVSVPGISAQIDGAHIPCWKWRAIVKVSGLGEYRFGDDAYDDLIWSGVNPSEVVVRDMGQVLTEWLDDVAVDLGKLFDTPPTTSSITSGSVAIEDLSGLTTVVGFAGEEFHYSPVLTNRKMPIVVVDSSGNRYFGSIQVDVATKHAVTCQNEVDLLILSSIWAEEVKEE